MDLSDRSGDVTRGNQPPGFPGGWIEICVAIRAFLPQSRSDLVYGSSISVRALTVRGNILYAGGTFDLIGGTSARRVAAWNGSAWSSLGEGTDGGVLALAVQDGKVYAGGTLNRAGGVSTKHLACWDDRGWTAVGTGLGGRFDAGELSVGAMATDGETVYAGGFFPTAGGVQANGLASWDGTTWSPLAGGVTAPYRSGIQALALSGSDLYAGGLFTQAGGIDASNIACWNGEGWLALGSGVNGNGYALAAGDGEVYAGGNFTVAGGIPVSAIAKWDGSRWSALGGGILGTVYALTFYEGALHAGGLFGGAGNVSARNIARWDGSTWLAVGGGVTGPVHAMAVGGGMLYAGGRFSGAGDGTASCIAQWDGLNWGPLGTGIDVAAVSGSTVYSLAAAGRDLYAGGFFRSAGGKPANMIAKWDGQDWSAMGSGMDGYSPSVNALTLTDDGIFAAGGFSSAGGKLSPYIALAHLPDSDGDGLPDSWERAHWPDLTGQGATDDPDNDGYNNLLELALGLNPRQMNPGGLPAVTTENSHLTMTLTKQQGVAYEIQTAGILGPGLNDSFSALGTTILINDGTTLKVRDNPAIGTAPQRFIRVKVTPAP